MNIPPIVTRIFDTWKKVGLWVGKNVARAVLMFVYVVLFAPFAVIMRYQYSMQRLQKRDSYFIDHEAVTDERYEHQF